MLRVIFPAASASPLCLKYIVFSYSACYSILQTIRCLGEKIYFPYQRVLGLQDTENGITYT